MATIQGWAEKWHRARPVPCEVQSTGIHFNHELKTYDFVVLFRTVIEGSGDVRALRVALSPIEMLALHAAIGTVIAQDEQ